MDTLNIGTFTGFKAVEPTLTDWKAGAETGILDTPINPSGDWRTDLPTDETQLMKATNGQSYGDTECCTNFSSTNVCEIYLNYLISQNKVPQAALDFLKNNGYYDSNGKINFSDRFDAYVSGTTTASGNSLPAVWQAKRTYGLAPESAWPMPTAQFDALVAKGGFTAPQDFWNIYFTKPPQTAYDIAQEFLNFFEPQYEWIAYTGAAATSSALQNALTVGPLQIATAVCNGWNTANPIQACGAGTAHATTLLNVEPATAYDIYDHYSPFQKRFAIDYTISWAMRGILVPLTTPTVITYPAPAGFTHTFSTQLDFGLTSPEVVALQNALKLDGDFPLTVQSTGYFGSVTQIALEKFQTKYGIASSGTPTTTGYGRVGPKTIAKLNLHPWG